MWYPGRCPPHYSGGFFCRRFRGSVLIILGVLFALTSLIGLLVLSTLLALIALAGLLVLPCLTAGSQPQGKHQGT